jgi:hypothetical protein
MTHTTCFVSGGIITRGLKTAPKSAHEISRERDARVRHSIRPRMRLSESKVVATATDHNGHAYYTLSNGSVIRSSLKRHGKTGALKIKNPHIVSIHCAHTTR